MYLINSILGAIAPVAFSPLSQFESTTGMDHRYLHNTTRNGLRSNRLGQPKHAETLECRVRRG